MRRSESLLPSIALPASVLRQSINESCSDRLYQENIPHVISRIISVATIANIPSLKTKHDYNYYI